MLLLTKTYEITSGVVGPDLTVYGILIEIIASQCHTLVFNIIKAQKKDFPLGFLCALTFKVWLMYAKEDFSISLLN